MDFVLVVAAALVGLLTGVLWARQRTARELAALDRARDDAREAAVRAQAERDALRDQLAQVRKDAEAELERDAARHKAQLETLKGEFALLSREALKLNSAAFMEQAGQSFDERRKQVEALLTPLKDQLEKLSAGTQVLETKREGAYASLQQQLAQLQAATENVTRTGHVLATALRGDARARGRWGEMALRNVAELAGMTRHCDFDLQEVQEDRSRPDMVVNLPGGDGRIPVDAKAPMDAYMRAIEATDPDAREAALREHAAALRLHVRDVAGRSYADKLGSRVAYTVLFVPAEPILAAAYEADASLATEALQRRVLLVTPVTLMALLLTVALYWRQADLASNAQSIADTAREYHDRLQVFMRHLAALGKSIDATVSNWNKAVGSYERSVLPQGRRLEELAPPSAQDKALPELAGIDEVPRDLPAAPPARELEAS